MLTPGFKENVKRWLLRGMAAGPQSRAFQGPHKVTSFTIQYFNIFHDNRTLAKSSQVRT